MIGWNDKYPKSRRGRIADKFHGPSSRLNASPSEADIHLVANGS